jgi:FAD/FMN-containing dehydrogenase
VGDEWPISDPQGRSHRPRRLASGQWQLTSWSRTHVFTPRDVYAPTSVDELLAVVEEGGRAGRRLKPAGSLHSWSPCAVTDDVSVQIGRLDRVLAIDPVARTVRAEAGIRMRDLYAQMERAGVALPALPNVDTIQLGGAISNATHGTCIETGSMCSLVSEIEIVVFTPGPGGAADGRARLLTLRRDGGDAHERHLFEAAVASFGSIGVIYAVTLRGVEPYHSYVHELVLPFAALEHRLAATARQHYSVRFMWFPLTDLVFTKVQVPIRGPLVRARSRSMLTRFDIFVIRLVAFANERNPRRWRRLRDGLNRVLTWQLRQGREALLERHNKGALVTWYDAELESRLHAAFARHPFVNLEYAVPLDRLDAVVAALGTVVRSYRLRTMSAIGLRPVGADDAGYLAAPKGQQVAYVDIPYVADLEKTGLYAEIERTLIAFGGRCSWSRLIFSAPAEFLRNYPEHHRFVEAKQELDPCGVFSNAFSDRISTRPDARLT